MQVKVESMFSERRRSIELDDQAPIVGHVLWASKIRSVFWEPKDYCKE